MNNISSAYVDKLKYYAVFCQLFPYGKKEIE